MEKPVSICSNNDFRMIYRRGKSYVTPLVVVYVKKNRTAGLRLGITTSKKIGNAVCRSRARRVLREGLRPLFPRIVPGYDLILVARGKTPFVKSTEVRRHLEKQLVEAGVLLPEGSGSPSSGKRSS